jgi:TRAP-type uncharacterized transport system substrate-binding protein
VLLLAAAAVLWLAWRVVQPTPEKRLVIATGPEQGAYDDFAKRYRPWLQAQGIAVELRATQGSGENLALLRDRRSGVHAAFVQGGAVGPAPEGAPNDPVESLGSMAQEPLWLFYRTDSLRKLRRGAADPPVQLAQLAGWRIDVGPEGGGSAALFRRLWAEHGLPAEALQRDSRATVHGVLDLVQGRVDALALVSAADAPLVQYLLRTPGVQLFDFVQAEAYARRFPALRALKLPRGVVDLAADLPPRDVQLVAATASLAARADLHPALVQLLLQAARQAHGEAGWFQRSGEFPQAAADELPLAADAERYYRQGPPWLQRYLPFWLANLVDRMWIVVLPLLAALLPLSRIVPPLVTLRLRSRVYRWYADLRAIERALERPGADLADLRRQIEQLDTQTEQIGVPLSFTNELYDLRGHVHMVRKRIQLRQAAGDGASGIMNTPPGAPP